MTEIDSIRKRSRHVALVLAGTATLALAACEDDRVDAQDFPDLANLHVASKVNGLWFTEDDCRKNFAAAEQEHLETAPRYESRELCEKEHGAGQCEGDPTAQNSGGGFSFMPLLVGYMMGSMLSRGGGIFSQPMVRTASGGYGRTRATRPSPAIADRQGRGSTFQRAPSTIGKPPMTASQVSRAWRFRRGRHRALGSRSSWSSFQAGTGAGAVRGLTRPCVSAPKKRYFGGEKRPHSCHEVFPFIPENQIQKSRALCELAPVIPVLVVADASKAEGLATALVAGGLPGA